MIITLAFPRLISQYPRRFLDEKFNDDVITPEDYAGLDIVDWYIQIILSDECAH